MKGKRVETKTKKILNIKIFIIFRYTNVAFLNVSYLCPIK